jgi:cation transport ATPase
MSGHGDARGLSPRTDLVVAAVFLVFGAAVIVAAFAMPTFTDQGTPLYVAPGVVPGFQGVVLAVLSLVLGARSLLRGALHATSEGGTDAQSLRRIAVAAVLAVGFAAGLIGRVPFWLAASVFVFCFVMAFEWDRTASAASLRRNAAIAAGIGLATGFGITLLFERVFLIRMP